jgi:VWFA-related protein
LKRFLLIWVILFPAGAAAQEKIQNKPVPSELKYSVQSQLVQIYFRVTEGGRGIEGISERDLTLLEDGKAKEIARLDAQDIPLQVALLLDTSESMRDAIQDTQEAAVYFVESMKPADRIHFIPFNSDIKIFSQTGDDPDPIVEVIRSTEASGGTELYEALLFAMRTLRAQQGRKAIVVFSDGEDTSMSSSLHVALNAAARYGYPIYTIGAGDALGNEKLNRILDQFANTTSGNSFLVEEPAELRHTFGRIATELRTAYVANYYTDVPFDGRWHDLEIRPLNPEYRVRHRKGFYARTSGSRDPVTQQEEAPDGVLAALAAPREPEPAIEAEPALAALAEILDPPISARKMDVPSPGPPSGAAGGSEQEKPVFRVESRFVEVPVLLESRGGQELPILEQEDFRIYEDDSLKEIIFFNRDVQTQGMAPVRELAKKKAESEAEPGIPTSFSRHNRELVLGRYYMVLDDMLTEPGAFLSAKVAAKKILREYHGPLRPFSVHLTSQTQSPILAEDDLEATLEMIDRIVPKVPRNLISNNRVMSIYEAFLIERGDRQAKEIAELRYALDLNMSYENDLGAVEGLNPADPERVETGVRNIMTELISENSSQVSRVTNSLRALVGAASAEPGSHPRVVIFISSGFVVGRVSLRSALGRQMEHAIGAAKRQGIRFYTLDASGLEVVSPIGVDTSSSFLASNPHLETILYDHGMGWKRSRESSLNQLAVDTGGAYLHGTNDIPALADKVMRRTGQLYYLGYFSKQPPDGRYHRIRVTTSQTGAIISSRRGFFAVRQLDPAADGAGADSARDWTAVADMAARAFEEEDYQQASSALEQLVRRFPEKADLWYNLGITYLRMNRADMAVEMLQRAYSLSPGDREIGLSLARALMTARYREAAARTLVLMSQKLPDDSDLLVQLGRVYEADSRPQEAYQAYRKVLDISSRPPRELYVLLIRTALPLGRRVEAGLFIRDYLAAGGEREKIQPWLSEMSPNSP